MLRKHHRWEIMGAEREDIIVPDELDHSDNFGTLFIKRGRVQTTWTEFWAILTPFPLC